MSTWIVFWYALLAAVATGLGAIPFFFVKTVSPRMVAVSNALAGGLMLGASLVLLYQGYRHGAALTALGVAVGLAFIFLADIVLRRSGEFNPEDLIGANMRKMVVIVGIMTVHSFAEGVSIGFAFGGTALFGVLIALSLAIHNIPEGLAISAVLVPKGQTPWRAALWSIFSSLPQPVMAVPAFLFVSAFHSFLPSGLGFAAGAMLWLVFSELIPDSRKDLPPIQWLPIVTVSAALMLVVGLWLPA